MGSIERTGNGFMTVLVYTRANRDGVLFAARALVREITYAGVTLQMDNGAEVAPLYYFSIGVRNAGDCVSPRRAMELHPDDVAEFRRLAADGNQRFDAANDDARAVAAAQ
jgi:hypothetical protein